MAIMGDTTKYMRERGGEGTSAEKAFRKKISEKYKPNSESSSV